MYLGVGIQVIARVIRALLSHAFAPHRRQPPSFKMQWKALALALFVGHGSSQGSFPMLRFQCSQLVVDRIDPLVSPGAIPAPHLHQIVGGNSFNATMDPATHDLPKASTCTSCTF